MRRLKQVAVLLLAADLVAGLLIMTGVGCSREALEHSSFQLPKVNLGKVLRAPKHQPVERVGLSEPQKLLVDNFGWPDVFTVSYDDEGQRLELWTWYQCNSGDALLQESWTPRGVYWVNGELRNAAAAPQLAGLKPTELRPTEFDPTLTREALQQQWGKPQEVKTWDSPVYGQVEAWYMGEHLMLAFRNGQFWGAQSFPRGER